jgi:alkanesulfonate monooxygenase SsuD/methylene tetrahydromethanopterin reductase-like flavin-dependent oxidoreductase (luciferase family)
MRSGLTIGTSGALGATAADARRAERLGFDLLASGEHVFFHGPTSNAFLTLATAAGVTERVRLLSALTILPLYPMALAAKMACTLDLISNGRFDLGIGVGGEYPPEFAAVGAPVVGRGSRTDEALEVMVRLLSGERVSAEGPFGSLRDLRLEPPPVQRPHPPIWVGGRQTPAMRRAGRFGDVWMPYMVSPGSFARSLAQARVFAEQAGRPAGSLTGALFIWGCVDDDRGRARREAVEFVSGVYRQDFGPLADRYLLHGDPDTVTAPPTEYHAAVAEMVIFSPACAPERHADVTALFARAVRPRLPPA